MSKLTVETDFTDDRDDPRKLARCLRQVRTALNQKESRLRALTTAATNTLTEIYRSDPLGADEVAEMRALVVGTSEDGSVYARYEFAGLFQRVGVTAAAQRGATVTLATAIESHAGLDCQLGVNSDSEMFVKVTDGGVGTVEWSAWVEVRRP